MAATQKGKALLYTCTIISTVVIILIALNIFGIFTVPKSGGSNLPLGSDGRSDWMFILTFNVFPVLIFFNLVFWAFTAVSGRMISKRPGFRQAMQIFYTLLTISLVGILLFRLL